MTKLRALILLSETDPFLSRVYKHKFEQLEGWETQIASTTDDLMALVTTNAPDLIVTDIILTNGSAYETLAAIREHEDKAISSIPIIILTDLQQEEDISRAKELGVEDYLVKNEKSFEDVLSAVRQVLATRVA